MWLAVAAAVLSFIGSRCLAVRSEARSAKLMLWLVAACSIAAAIVGSINCRHNCSMRTWWIALSVATSGLVLGLVFAAMLLGHWYLNAPGMELAPLRRLLAAAALAVAIQAVVSGSDLAAEMSVATERHRIAGCCSSCCAGRSDCAACWRCLWMAWQTLEIPNTQSATGILYVAVIGVFVGELTGLLLSAESCVSSIISRELHTSRLLAVPTDLRLSSSPMNVTYNCPGCQRTARATVSAESTRTRLPSLPPADRHSRRRDRRPANQSLPGLSEHRACSPARIFRSGWASRWWSSASSAAASPGRIIRCCWTFAILFVTALVDLRAVHRDGRVAHLLPLPRPIPRLRRNRTPRRLRPGNPRTLPPNGRADERASASSSRPRMSR